MRKKSLKKCTHRSWTKINAQGGYKWRCQDLDNINCEIELTPAEWYKLHDKKNYENNSKIRT